MGMDVHGLNPKQNKTLEEFPVLKKYKEMVSKQKSSTRAYLTKCA